MVNLQLLGPLVCGVYSLATHGQILGDNTLYERHNVVVIEMTPIPQMIRHSLVNRNLWTMIGQNGIHSHLDNGIIFDMTYT